MVTALHDIQRHQKFFKPENIGDKKIAIVGCGAIGSYLAIELAALGMGNQLALYDFDNVETHNIPNQYFGVEDVGKSKTEAIAEAITRKVGHNYENMSVYNAKIPKYDEDCDDQALDVSIQHLKTSNIIFSCVDSMEARKMLFEDYFLNNSMAEVFFEVRIGTNNYEINKILKSDQKAIDIWADNWYSDDEVDMSEADACGSTPTIGSVVLSAVSSVSQWIKHIYDINDAYALKEVGIENTLSDPRVYRVNYYGSTLRVVLSRT